MNRLAYAALWSFVFALPWESVLVMPGIAIATRLTGGIALAITLFTILLSGKLRRLHLLHSAALMFVLWAAIALLAFNGLLKIPNKLFTYIQLFTVLWMIWELARTVERQRGLFLAYVLGAHVAALDTVFVYRHAGAAVRRYTAGGDPNDLAMTLALAVPMAWYLGLTHPRPWVRWVCRAYIPIGVMGIALTGSRGGMLTTALALLVIPLTMTNLSPGKLAGTIALLGLAGGLATIYVPDKIVARLATTGTEVEDLRVGGRFKLWVAGAHAFAQRPFMGYGTGGFKPAITPELGDKAQVAHNSYVSLLVEEGLVGFFLYMTMLGAVFASVLTLPRLERRFGLVLMAAMALAMFPLTWEDRKPVWFILAALLGLSKAYLPAGRGPTTAVITVPAPRLARPRPTRRRIGPSSPIQDADVSG